MRVAFVGGTRFVGPFAVALLSEAGHEVAVAHTGAHEHDRLQDIEHLHGPRDELLASRGLVERWRPEAIVDTFAGGATAEKARALAACAQRAGARHIVAISSMDVYQHCVDAGLADGSAAVALPVDPIPLHETGRLRHGPYPGGGPEHDNVAMEAALEGAGRVTALRPGAIYGPHPETREWFLVDRVARGIRRLELPDGGVQVWHRVAVERVGRAIVAALNRAPNEFWACNVVDPYDWDYAGLAGEIGRLLDWCWEPVRAAFSDTDHPWQVTHPVLCSDERLRRVLGVTEPDPMEALAQTIRWLWDRRSELAPSAPLEA
jgi:nucleoside-diphosphate-sugar epimerase